MRDIFIVFVDEYVGMYIPNKCPSVGYAKRDEFVDFIGELRKEYPEHRMRCVIDENIEKAVRRNIQANKMLQIYKSKCR